MDPVETARGAAPPADSPRRYATGPILTRKYHRFTAADAIKGPGLAPRPRANLVVPHRSAGAVTNGPGDAPGR